MNRVISILMVLAFVLCGCSVAEDLRPLEELRKKLGEGNGCEFTVEISAEYDLTVHTFTLRCAVSEEDGFRFSVVEPESISGICGVIDQSGGNLTFDDKLLAFPLLADGELSPVCGPWLFYRNLADGLIRLVSKEEDGYRITIDDSFRGEELQIELWLSESGMPSASEVFWNDRRVIKMQIEDFRIL